MMDSLRRLLRYFPIGVCDANGQMVVLSPRDGGGLRLLGGGVGTGRLSSVIGI